MGLFYGNVMNKTQSGLVILQIMIPDHDISGNNLVARIWTHVPRAISLVWG